MRQLGIFLISFYRFLGPIWRKCFSCFGLCDLPCIFPVSCSEFALIELEKSQSFAISLKSIFKRIISCHRIL